MSTFKMVVTIHPDPDDKTSLDAAFSTVGRDFVSMLASGPQFAGKVVRADIDNNNMVNLYVEGTLS